jgi:hypothetical protein
MMEGSGSRAGYGSLSLTKGSGSGRPKKHIDPTDPDPEKVNNPLNYAGNLCLGRRFCSQKILSLTTDRF